MSALICTYGVGSTGLTLTKSNTVILVDRPWTPGDVLQAEDRVRRIGQLSKSVESIWISANEMDMKLDKLLQTKDVKCQTLLSNEPNSIKHFFDKRSKNDSNKVSAKGQLDIRNYFAMDSSEDGLLSTFLIYLFI